jgi:hypothetical protein
MRMLHLDNVFNDLPGRRRRSAKLDPQSPRLEQRSGSAFSMSSAPAADEQAARIGELPAMPIRRPTDRCNTGAGE